MRPSKTKPNKTETQDLSFYLLSMAELAPWKSDISSSLCVLEIMQILPQRTFVHPGLKFLLSSTDNTWATSKLLDSLHYQMALSGRNKDIFSYRPTLGLLLQTKAEKKSNKKMKVTISHLAARRKTLLFSVQQDTIHALWSYREFSPSYSLEVLPAPFTYSLLKWYFKYFSSINYLLQN